MSKYSISAILITVGLSGFLRPSMAQSKGPVEDMMRQVVAALGSNDQAALEKLCIAEGDFKKYVWPTMSARVYGGNTTAAKYYPTYQTASRAGIAEAETALAGKRWEVVSVSAEPAQKQGSGYQLFPGPMVTLRGEGGQEKTIRLVGGLLERDGAYRVTTYYVNPTQRASK
jgi:hypothetical protein